MAKVTVQNSVGLAQILSFPFCRPVDLWEDHPGEHAQTVSQPYLATLAGLD